MRPEIIFIGLIFVLITANMLHTTSIFGHNFKSDESAEFLAFTDKVKAELQLIRENIEEDDMNMAKTHSLIANDLYWLVFQNEIAEKNERIATNLKDSLLILQNSSYDTEYDIDKIRNTIGHIEDTLTETISIRVNPEHINNSTIQMLRLNNLLNSIDIYYTKGVETRTSNLQNVDYNNSEIIGKNLSKQNNTVAVIDNPAYYQSALELTKYTQNLFDIELREYVSNDETKMNYIYDNLGEIKNLINSKMSHHIIYDIISSTQSMINQNFNLSLL